MNSLTGLLKSTLFMAMQVRGSLWVDRRIIASSSSPIQNVPFLQLVEAFFNWRNGDPRVIKTWKGMPTLIWKWVIMRWLGNRFWVPPVLQGVDRQFSIKWKPLQTQWDCVRVSHQWVTSIFLLHSRNVCNILCRPGIVAEGEKVWGFYGYGQ